MRPQGVFDWTVVPETPGKERVDGQRGSDGDEGTPLIDVLAETVQILSPVPESVTGETLVLRGSESTHPTHPVTTPPSILDASPDGSLRNPVSPQVSRPRTWGRKSPQTSVPPGKKRKGIQRLRPVERSSRDGEARDGWTGDVPRDP